MCIRDRPRADQHQGGISVRECPYHPRPSADLPVQPLDHIVGADAGPVFAWEIAVGPVSYTHLGDDASHRTLEYYNTCVDGSGIAVAADSFAALEQRIERENRLRWCDVITALDVYKRQLYCNIQ